MIFKTIILIALSLFSLGCIPSVYALESSNSATNSAIAKYKIVFPIPELDNCEDQDACKLYCSNVQNQSACTAYAKAKGFYKERELPGKAALLLRARAELGCDSEISCKTICEQKENKEKCKTFAQKYQIVKEKLIEDQKKLLELAKEFLKCETPSACKELCFKLENKDKCKEVFKLSLSKKPQPITEKAKTAFERAREKFGTATAKPKPTLVATSASSPSSTSAVQGASTTQGIFSQILNFLNSLFQ